MKLKLIISSLCGLTALGVIAAVALHWRLGATPSCAPIPPHVRELEVMGQIRALESDGKTVVIAHEEIPDFMPAMTMPFEVKDPRLLRGLAPGDRVRFSLAVTRDNSWISRIEKLGSATNPMEQAANVPPASEAPRLHPGDAVPDFTLIDQRGRPWRLRDFRGQAVLMTFIYTRCPLPNFCPLMSKNFAALQEQLGRDLKGRFHLLSVSFDSEHDTPAVLRQYASVFSHDESTWSFACGTPAQVEFVTGLFGLVHLPEGGAITHDLRTALIGPDGKLVHVWRSNVWTPEEVASWVRELLVPL